MDIRNKIEAELITNVRYELDEMDIDGMVKRLVNKKEVKDAVTKLVKEKIATLVQERAFARIQKQMPIIDACVNEKVQEFLYKLGVK